ncbi:SusC/RagA family TonB-linked outer membrane protein [Abyssalbus ytuae]|uniref:SusC/RagA family TonB-linked outer membrane protein n=1 Tax=Abyssalbus ytuae TaxID=2926907 RepID=A0A9E6ZR44_9FLAO|nr:SusC/RagA family TonB-linked outer membrane protein [Abyssalbus ytuae]UOB17268.1 SusC/RagA family TonB-linked outer membrane protein [Abyssalbus ytuae]
MKKNTYRVCINAFMVFMLFFSYEISVGQNINFPEDYTLTVNNGSLISVLNQIENQTSFSFAYNNEDIDTNQKITFKDRKYKIEEVIAQISMSCNLSFNLVENIIYITKNKNSGQKEIKINGQVKDSQGNPLPGATVIEKETNNGVSTDFDGRFSMNVQNSHATLIISFLGYQSKEIYADNNLDIILEEEATDLDEIVLIGYGSLKRKDLTSSVTTVNSEDLNSGVYTNPMQMLQGIVPGLNITNDGDPTSTTTSIILRGASTLREGSAQEPFFVIDGVPGVSLSLISPDDIISVDILKDASAAAIYGTRAANGVIIITTKKGEEQSKISYNSYVAVESISNKIDMMSASEYRNYLSSNGYSLDPENDTGASIDWQDEVTQTGFSQNHNLSLSGKSKNTSYYSSLNYLDKEGIIKKTGLERITINGKINQKAMNDKLSLGFSLAGTVTNTDQVPNKDELFESMIKYLPTVDIKNEDGSYRENYNYSSFNPIALIEQNTREGKDKIFLGSVNAKYNIIDNISIEATASYQNSQSNLGIYYSKDSRLAYGLEGYAFRSSFEEEKKILELIATYSNQIGSHDFRIMSGYSWQEDKTGNGFQASNIGFISDETLYYNLGLASPPEGYFPDYGNTSLTTLRTISFFTRLNYQYKNKYLLQGTVRSDGSSAFGENNRWGTFPSFSAGWIISEENFMSALKNLDNLKIRVGYGISGNSLGFNPLISRLRYSSSGKFYYDGEYINGIFPSQNANPDLKWEKTSMWNFGLDWALFNNRLSGTVEYYNKLTKDLIWNYPVSTVNYIVGNLTANAGSIRNKGIELSVNAIPFQTNNFNWQTSLMIASNKNEIESLSNDKFQLDFVKTASAGDHGQSGLYTQIIEEGHPIGQFHLIKYAGRDENGQSLFYAADGSLTTNPTTNDYYYDGDAQPDLTFSWQNSFSYKNWGLNFLFRGVTGNLILNTTLSNLNYPIEATHFNLPKMTLNEPINDSRANYTSTRYLEKGDYLRLDNITLSYTFNMKKDDIKSIKLYTTANNVFVITGYNGLDPEVNLGGITPGIDNDNYYPKTRTLLFGINATF